MSSLADFVKNKATEVLAASRNFWRGLRLEDKYQYSKPLTGFRLSRAGKHKDTMLTRHEQTRNPAGSKWWKSLKRSFA